MDQYRINLAGFGITDDNLLALRHILVPRLEIIKKGDVWNKRTGKKYEENIIRLQDCTTYTLGFSAKVDDFIATLESTPILKEAFQNCNEVELQIRVTMIGDETGIPSIQISSEQMKYLSKMDTRIDIDLVRME